MTGEVLRAVAKLLHLIAEFIEQIADWLPDGDNR